MSCKTVMCRIFAHFWGFWLASLLMTIGSQPALAWNGTGHRLVAALAWEQLSFTERAEIAAVLAEHPDAHLWDSKTDRARPLSGRELMLQAATWPDELRERADTTDAASTRSWHYINWSLEAGQPAPPIPGQVNLATALEDALQRSRRSQPTADRANALAWLVHLVADAHQPLHTATRIDADGQSDLGGNRLRVIDPWTPIGPKTTNLHRYWDQLPWSTLFGRAFERAMSELEAKMRACIPGVPAARWIVDSHQIAASVAYGLLPSGTHEIELSAAYRDAATGAAKQQLACAAIRLSETLRAILSVPRSAN